MTEQLWIGEFGRAYLERNRDAGGLRRSFWRDLLHRFPVESVLEVGCNVGQNLRHLVGGPPAITGIDLNEEALELARAHLGDRVRLEVGTALLLPFQAAAFDLVFTSGLLIHIGPDDIGRAIDELVRVTRDLVLVIEYYAPVETVVPYRGQDAALWKRPWDRLVPERHPELRLLEQGPLLQPDGWDDCMYYLWRKP